MLFRSEGKAFLADRLERAQLLGLKAGAIEIGETPGHFYDYLRDSENFSFLQTSARRFFERDVKIVLSQISQSKHSSGPERDGTSAESGQNEMLKEALRLFGGTVRGPSGGSEKGSE